MNETDFFTRREIELAAALRELDIDWTPLPGDWAMVAAERNMTIVLGQTETGDVITAGAPSEPIAVERLFWLPSEKRLLPIILKNGIEFLTIEAAADGCKCFGWSNKESWKAAEQESVWSKGETPLEAMLFLLIKLLS